jgi:hypothetical protein
MNALIGDQGYFFEDHKAFRYELKCQGAGVVVQSDPHINDGLKVMESLVSPCRNRLQPPIVWAGRIQ